MSKLASANAVDRNLLEVTDIETCYGTSQVLFGMSLAIAPGEMVTLMGRNGMGKTTTIRSIMGLTPARKGSIRFLGEDTRTMPSYRVARLGMGLVPEGRQIFRNLTVRENLIATANHREIDNPWTLDRVIALFLGWPSGSRIWETCSPAANSKCSPSGAR